MLDAGIFDFSLEKSVIAFDETKQLWWIPAISGCKREPVLIHRGERLLTCCFMHRHIGPALCVMVSCGIGYHSRPPLVRIAGTLISQHLISEALWFDAFLNLQSFSTVTFHRDNARPQMARNIQDNFFIHQNALLFWSNCSPYLLSIENVWSMNLEHLARNIPTAATPDQFWQYVEAAWTAVSQQHIDTLFDLMPSCEATVVVSNGLNTQ